MWAWSCRERGRTCYYDMTTDELVCYQCGHRRKVQRQPSPQQNDTEPGWVLYHFAGGKVTPATSPVESPGYIPDETPR